RPPTRRFIGSLSALLHEGAHEGLGVRLEHRVDLVEQVVGRLGGGEGLPAGDGLGARLVVGTGAGGVQGLLGHGVLLVSVVWSAGADGSVERLEDGLGVVGGVDAVLRAPVRGAQARVGQAQPVPAGGAGQGDRVPAGGGDLFAVRGDQSAAQV